MRTARRSTVLAVAEAHKRLRSFDAVIENFGLSVSKGTLSRILRSVEGVSVEAEREVRSALGIGRKRATAGISIERELRQRLNTQRLTTGETWTQYLSRLEKGSE